MKNNFTNKTKSRSYQTVRYNQLSTYVIFVMLYMCDKNKINGNFLFVCLHVMIVVHVAKASKNMCQGLQIKLLHFVKKFEPFFVN